LTTLPDIVWITVAYLAVFSTAGTFFLLQYATMRIPAAKAIAYGYLMPSYIIVLEGLSGAGWVSRLVTAGALITILGLVILIRSNDV
jgi:drug/metabolite transporter (DMT)-like permease